ncbi:uncharacterized protein [Amphiura filiformis]|uniref:uncharacterized protein n=1 Tax=Amphiura filiformis TaxID=82378 RepID=UPI003B218E56
MGYRQLVDVPTHRLLRTLDLLIVKDDETLVSEWDVNPTYYSDHLMINCVLDVTRVMISKTFRVSRNFKAIDHQIFATDLAEKINSVLEQGHTNVNDLVKGYNNTCLNVLDTHAPVKSKPRSVRFKPKWYNDDVIKARREIERRRYERRWRKTGLDADYQIYIVAKSTAADVIVREKSNFYKNKFADCTSSSKSKDIYKTVNELLNVSGNVLPDSDTSAELANNFCDYFVGKVNKIRCELDMYDPCSSNSTTSHENQSVVSCNENQSVVSCNLFDFQLITEDDLCKIIEKCPTKSCPLDPMPTWLVKQDLETLATILTAIVNVSLSSGVFPAELSKAVITPVLKNPSLDRNLLSNYRPVSNLPFVGKLIEKVVSTQVSNYINVYELSDPHQSAYKVSHSTETALTCVQNDILRAIDNQQAVLLLMLDLSAAFDTVDHGILLERLAGDFGIKGKVQNWFKTYLEGRTGRVHIDGVFSDDKSLIYGVPQGSVIGPQAFTYYTRRVGQIIESHHLLYHIYADDVQIYTIFDPNCHGDAACALFKLSQCVNDLQAWMLRNRLKLNQSKTEFFIASSAHHYKTLQYLTLHLGNQEIPSSPSIRNLGVIF